MPAHVQLKDCRFITSAESKEDARMLADAERARGVCVRVVKRASDDGKAKVWKLFETKPRSAITVNKSVQPKECPTCAGLQRLLADAEARIAQLTATPQPAPSKKKGAPKLRVVGSGWADPDPRLPSNTKPHEPYTGTATRGTVASRKRIMEACLCRLCALCLRPPMTFEEAARFGCDCSDCQPPRSGRVQFTPIGDNAPHPMDVLEQLTKSDDAADAEACGRAFDEGRAQEERDDAARESRDRKKVVAFLRSRKLGGEGLSKLIVSHAVAKPEPAKAKKGAPAAAPKVENVVDF